MDFSSTLLPPTEEPQNAKPNTNLTKKQKKRKRKNKQKKLKQLALKDLKKKDVKFNHMMSSWAESFTQATTWQLQHQLAYWKAKATSLQYENKVLRDIIQKTGSLSVQPGSPVGNSSSSSDQSMIDYEDEDEGDNSDLEASEELIQFLASNAKYKQDALRERERLKAKYEQEKIVEINEETPQETTDHKQECLKELYGEQWQTVSALETSVQLQFISECDKTKPTYWPNIPLNFNYS